ncbi:MAG: endopeptidase La [Flavobacteriia bacterium]|nr:endopeptidase La [Flavobacteriia bacterium]OJX39046.1 MAG: endopeptidase La [Flavobacteriia bacterium 40-80]
MDRNKEEDILSNLSEALVQGEAELIPLLTSEDEEHSENGNYPEDLSILALRNNVLFPGVVIPITVARDKSLKIINEQNKKDRLIGVISQTDPDMEDPDFEHLYEVGTLAKIMKVIKMPDDSTTVILQGKKKFKIVQPLQTDPVLKSQVEYITDKKYEVISEELDMLYKTIKEKALYIIKENPSIPNEASFAISNIDSPAYLLNFIASHMDTEVDKKQEVLEIQDPLLKAYKILEHLSVQAQVLELKNDIHNKVRKDLDRQQRDYYLNQQIKTIQEELGDNPAEMELERLKKKAAEKKWTEKESKIFEKELMKFQRLNPQGADYSVQLNYLDLLLDLPWFEYTSDNLDIKHAQEILDRDHYGLEDVKRRILEYLAVLKLKGDMKSPILCFYGPPGVGKTSLGKSIATALDRKYVRMSLGGLHDESEIRGHRKTYIGAMPGRVIQSLKKSGSANPVFILDEIDKLGRSNHGDPSSALLEVLDPEQNAEFYDNYVETEFDLSKVMFIATANSLQTVQGPLRDRMEIIEVSGYTIEEKIEIAKRHLIPKQLEAHGVEKKQFNLEKKIIEKVVEEYTHESGVRGLEKIIAKLVRNRAKQIAMEEEFDPKLTYEEVVKILGPGHPRTKSISNDVAGVVTGLAWTSVGGDILFIESSITKGKGKVTLTGNLGEVMKESAIIALEFLKAHSNWIGLDQEVFDKYNVHIHVPEGATPKDGPSAGITMLTSLASLFSQRKVKKNLAMTGEITLRGEVLPVGGIKEKILAAKRASIKEIILCEKNKKDVMEINPEYIKGLVFHYVTTMKEVIDIALTSEKVKYPITIE